MDAQEIPPEYHEPVARSLPAAALISTWLRWSATKVETAGFEYYPTLGRVPELVLWRFSGLWSLQRSLTHG